MQGRTIAAFLLGTVVALILVAVVGPAALASSLASAHWGLVGAALATYALFFLLRGLRWSLLLRAHASVPVPSSASLSAVAWTVSSFVPLKAGDAVRTAWMARRERLGLAAVAGTVAVERTFDVLGLAVVCSVALLALAGGAGPWTSGLLALAWLLPLALIAFLFAAARMLPPHRRKGRLLRAAGAGLDALPMLARRPRQLALLLILTLLVALAQAAVYFLLAWALLPGAPVLALAAAAPLFVLTFAFPITPAHVGTYEAGFVAAFSMTGLPATQLLSAALAAHILSAAAILALGGTGLAMLWNDPGRPSRGKVAINEEGT